MYKLSNCSMQSAVSLQIIMCQQNMTVSRVASVASVTVTSQQPRQHSSCYVCGCCYIYYICSVCCDILQYLLLLFCFLKRQKCFPTKKLTTMTMFLNSPHMFNPFQYEIQIRKPKKKRKTIDKVGCDIKPKVYIQHMGPPKEIPMVSTQLFLILLISPLFNWIASWYHPTAMENISEAPIITSRFFYRTTTHTA